MANINIYSSIYLLEKQQLVATVTELKIFFGSNKTKVNLFLTKAKSLHTQSKGFLLFIMIMNWKQSPSWSIMVCFVWSQKFTLQLGSPLVWIYILKVKYPTMPAHH